MIAAPVALNLAPDQKASLWKRMVAKTELNDNGCWVWGGHRDKKGYGQIKVGKVARWVHRVAWAIAWGEIPADMTINHKKTCLNPSCWNPAHLELMTRPDNTREANQRRYAK